MSSMIRWEPFREMSRWEPFGELSTLHDRIERLFNEVTRRFGGPDGGEVTAGVWYPPVDVYETNESIVVKSDLPEVKPNEV